MSQVACKCNNFLFIFPPLIVPAAKVKRPFNPLMLHLLALELLFCCFVFILVVHRLKCLKCNMTDDKFILLLSVTNHTLLCEAVFCPSRLPLS